MEQQVVDLINCLNIQRELYLIVERLSILKKQIIAGNDIKTLDSIICEEKLLLEKITSVDLDIESIKKVISAHMSIENGQLTITKIIEYVDSIDLKYKLREVADEFNNILCRQRKLNKINQDMLQRKIKNIKSTMNSIMLENENLTYDYEGNDRINKRQKINIFDERV